MITLKLYFHFVAFVKILFYKLIYRKQFQLKGNFTFRKGFTLVIDDKGIIEIGDNCFFNNYCTLAARSSITIGEGSLFGENVKVYDHNHCFHNPLIPIKDQGYKSAPISIGNHCWIGSNVTILKGVSIGDNCVIGAGCIVHESISAGTLLINKQDHILDQISFT